MKVIAIIQARMKSERLPGKVLMNIPFGSGKPILEWIVDSIQLSKMIDKCIIATSINKENDDIKEFCDKKKVDCFRGSENNVLNRFINIIKKEKAEVIIRLTADNPLVDIQKLDRIVSDHIKSQCDYTSTQDMPLGMNFEVISSKAFLSINEKIGKDEEEHVTLHIRKSNIYSKQLVSMNNNKYLKDLRVTIDYPEDYLVVSHILSLVNRSEIPTLKHIEKIFNQTPWVFNVNSKFTQNSNIKMI